VTTTLTRQVRFDRLQSRGADAAVVVKLMMACNDLAIANQALDDWKQSQPKERREQEIGARMYFVRLELSHLFEAMKIIDEIRRTPSLRQCVDRCDSRTQASFAEIEKFAHGGIHHPEFKKLIGQVRHNLTFHYYQCEDLVLKAIADRADRLEGRLSSITRGNTAHRWRFTVADDIVDSVVVRSIWSIPQSADLRVEADKIADRVHQILLWFVDFSGEFIWKYCEE
jgi:hypothetical protein